MISLLKPAAGFAACLLSVVATACLVAWLSAQGPRPWPQPDPVTASATVLAAELPPAGALPVAVDGRWKMREFGSLPEAVAFLSTLSAEPAATAKVLPFNAGQLSIRIAYAVVYRAESK